MTARQNTASAHQRRIFVRGTCLLSKKTLGVSPLYYSRTCVEDCMHGKQRARPGDSPGPSRETEGVICEANTLRVVEILWGAS